MPNPSLPVPAEVLERARRGDRAAHAELYSRFASPVFTLARRMLASSALAEDVLQETFVEVLCNIGRFRGEAEVGTWIKRIAINKCLMHVRSSWISRRGSAVDEPACEQRALDDQMALERALDRVPDVARAVVWLHDVEGYTHAEIGRLMGRTTSFSKSQLARARAPPRAPRRRGNRKRDESMYARTEDLLKLRELRELAPPPAVWERVLAEHEKRSAKRRFRHRALAAVAVGVTAGVLTFIALEELQPSAPIRLTAAGGVVTLVPIESASYAPLVAESARLEQLLAELPAPPRVVVGSTAGTIAGLEDRIAFVDAQLSYAAARDLEPSYREALWGERVELMNALVYVRFAQTQGF